MAKKKQKIAARPVNIHSPDEYHFNHLSSTKHQFHYHRSAALLCFLCAAALEIGRKKYHERWLRNCGKKIAMQSNQLNSICRVFAHQFVLSDSICCLWCWWSCFCRNSMPRLLMRLTLCRCVVFHTTVAWHKQQKNGETIACRSNERWFDECDNISYEVKRVPTTDGVKWVTISTNWKSFQWIKGDWKK